MECQTSLRTVPAVTRSDTADDNDEYMTFTEYHRLRNKCDQRKMKMSNQSINQSVDQSVNKSMNNDSQCHKRSCLQAHKQSTQEQPKAARPWYIQVHARDTACVPLVSGCTDSVRRNCVDWSFSSHIINCRVTIGLAGFTWLSMYR